MVAPLAVPDGALDPRDPVAKGRFVWWHENLMAAIDMTGFCAFSAAGLLADGLCSLDELAAWIAPRALSAAHGSPGRRLLAAGASLSILERALNQAWRRGDALRAPAGELRERASWLGALWDHPGMWPEYARLRGLDASGAPAHETWERLADESILDVGLPLDDAQPNRAADDPPERRPGRVTLRAAGPLARALGRQSTVDTALPAPLRDVLLAASPKEAPIELVRGGALVAAAYRAERRLAPTDLVHDGDELDLVVALSGG
jgi:hypothetical protein